MPVTPTYPGVYIEEIPSGVRTIVGVATSITAFIGRARRGPVNEAEAIFSFGDFERKFGGLHVDDPMGYAVRDFFLNGGTQAIIVRLFHPYAGTNADRAQAADAAKGVADKTDGADPNAAATAAETEAKDPKNSAEPRKSAATAVAAAARAAANKQGSTKDDVKKAAQAVAALYQPFTMTVDTLKLEPANPGSWTNQLRAVVDRNVSQSVADRYGLALGDLFNLTVTDKGTRTTEKFLNVTTKDSPRRIDRVLEAESQLVRWSGDYPSTAPNVPGDGKSDALSALDKALADAEKALADAEKALRADPSDAGKKTTRDNAKTARDKAQSDLAAAMTVQDSRPLTVLDYEGNQSTKTGLFALEDADLFNLLCIPPDARDDDTSVDVYSTALAYCHDRRAFLVVDPPKDWKNRDTLVSNAASKLTDLGLSGDGARNAAVFYPRLMQSDPLRDNQVLSFVPCGVMAGLMARTDATRGVWKAPAGIDASLNGVRSLEVTLTDLENGALNQVGINCLRAFPVYGRVSWGSRTLRGADQAADEYKYIPVRRTALFIEESLYRGLKWVVFEPNDEPLWAQIRLNAGAFMHNLFRQGAFQGTTPRDAYFVKCDKETTTQNDINLGIVNVLVGFAPLKPAEFVIVKLQQMAGQIEV